MDIEIYIYSPWLICLIVGGLAVIGATLATIFGRKK